MVAFRVDHNPTNAVHIAVDDSEWLTQISSKADLLVVVSEAYNTARMQQFMAEELQSLENSLTEFRMKTDAAASQLIARTRRRLSGPTITSKQKDDIHSVSTTDEYVRLIEHESARARIRNRIFGPLSLSHAGWMIILILAEAEAAGTELTIKSVAYSAGLPLSSALRKINEMCAAELLYRRSDPDDGRRSFVTLTARTKSQIQQYASALKSMSKNSITN